jgi:two-component system sensor histidine kinase KdpD
MTLALARTGEAEPVSAAASAAGLLRPSSAQARAAVGRARPYLLAALAVAAMLLLAMALDRLVGLANVSLVLLLAVLASALTGGLGPALFASLLSVLVVNFFFLPPLYALTIAASENVVALVVFGVVAVITSQLAGVARRQLLDSRRQETATATRYRFSRRLAGVGTIEALVAATVEEVAAALEGRAVILLPEGGRLALRAAAPAGAAPDARALAPAEQAWRRGAASGAGSASDWRFVPLRFGPEVGVVGVAKEAATPLDEGARRVLDAMAEQASAAGERIALVREVEDARLEAERERLRGALLASVSHDLRTPLASIVGAISSLRSYGGAYSEEARDELMATVHEEAERLDRFVGNLLDMARLESGMLAPHGAAVDVPELVDTALRRAATVLAGRRVELDVAADLPMVEADYLLLEQCLVNILDNAAKYAPAGSTVSISVRAEGVRVAIEVLDEGPGIPAAALERVFDKFYRADARDRQRAGTGLGLAICRGFVEAMGGTIVARNRPDRTGAVLAIALRAAPRAPLEIGASA